LGHGTSVAEIICGNPNAARGCDLFVGQVLDHRGVTTAGALAAAIHWSVEVGADLIHMSLGLRDDRQTLAEAVAAAVAAGCIIVASTPARGAGTFPARYPDVIRATGDARCHWDEISDLHSSQADFGGCPGAMRLGGASLGAAHVTRFLVEHIAPGLGTVAVRVELGKMARYTGIEVRRSEA
jgi:subtilisin family serine protease